MKKLLINLFGCPKSGKTTLMAYLFYNLKIKGVYCEMAADFPKGVLFEERVSVLKNQLYIFAMQEKRIQELYKYADVVITDCPILHSLIYNPEKYKTLHAFIIESHNKFNNLNIFLKRRKEVKYGSFKLFSPEKITQIENNILNMLKDYEYFSLQQEPDAFDKALIIVNNHLKGDLE